MDDPRRQLPSVERILSEVRAVGIEEGATLASATEAVRTVLASARAALSAGSGPPSTRLPGAASCSGR